MEAKERVEKIIKEKRGEKPGFNSKWLVDIIEMLSNFESKDQIIETFVSKCLSDENLDAMSEHGDFKNSKKEIDGFMQYLSKLLEQKGEKYFLKALEYSIDKTQDDGNYIDSLIKYIVLTNQADIKLESTIGKDAEIGMGKVVCSIGGLLLCDSRDIAISDDNNVEFEWLHTRKNLCGIKLGKMVMKKTCEDIIEHYPTSNLFARTVMCRNKGAQKFYCSLGGELYDLESKKTLNIDEFGKEYGVFVGVIFPKEKIADLAKQDVEMPKIEEKYLVQKSVKL